MEEVIIGQEFRGSYRFADVVGVYTRRNQFLLVSWCCKGTDRCSDDVLQKGVTLKGRFFSVCSDCDLSVRWEPAKVKGGGEGFSPAGIKDKDLLHSWVSKTRLSD